MNQTHLEHLVIAIVLQACVGLLTGDWLAGSLFGAGIFVGREHADEIADRVAARIGDDRPGGVGQSLAAALARGSASRSLSGQKSSR